MINEESSMRRTVDVRYETESTMMISSSVAQEALTLVLDFST